jgi:hypothetical protein
VYEALDVVPSIFFGVTLARRMGMNGLASMQNIKVMSSWLVFYVFFAVHAPTKFEFTWHI